MDLIMHRVTKESGLTDSANGSMAKDTEPLGSTTKGGRHVGLDKMCLLMEVQMQHHRADLLRSPEGSEVPEGALECSRMVQPTCVCQPAKLLERHLVGIEQDFADHQSTTTLKHAA